MIHRGTITLALLALVSVPASAQRFPVAEPEEVGLSAERLQGIDDVFQSYAEEGRIAGAVGVILRHGKLAYTGAWGIRDVAAGDPLEADDIFRIASMTKPITSVAVMMLYEEGHFFLRDPVGRYLPEARRRSSGPALGGNVRGRHSDRAGSPTDDDSGPA